VPTPYRTTRQLDALTLRCQRSILIRVFEKGNAILAQLEPPGASSASELPPEAAFRATLPEMKALGDEGLLPVNVDVVNAVTTVLACLPKLRAIRTEIEKHLPTFNLARFDKIEQYMLALNQANAIHRGALARRGSIADLAGEVTDLRDRLFEDAQSLANHDLLEEQRLEECKKSPSYRAIATDVFTLVALFKERWPHIENRTPVTAAFLQQAGKRAFDLLGAVGSKEQAPTTVGETQLVRQQVFTLFSRAYEDARSAVQYLRRDEGDANEIAPTYYTGRPRSSPPSNAAETPAAPSPEPKTKSAADADDAPPPIQINNPHNLPIDAPYVS
jgi:hypothetical protein